MTERKRKGVNLRFSVSRTFIHQLLNAGLALQREHNGPGERYEGNVIECEWGSSLMITRRQFTLLATAFASATLAGCSQSLPRMAVPEPLLNDAKLSGFTDIRFWGDAQPDNLDKLVRMAVAQRAQFRASPGQQSHTFLAISGGGSDGAYGAGLLAGWSETGARPEFDIVTGVSTGALISPFAFLGSGYDPQLREIYTRYSTKDILRSDVIGGLLGGPSLADATPFEMLIAKYVTDDFIQAVAREHRTGRRLLVGTTNIDAQRPVIWDMGAIAASGRPEAPALFRKILQASASLPGQFPPVRLVVQADGKTYDELHVDGGVTSQVFFLPTQIMLRSVSLNHGISLNQKLYVIRNGQITPHYQVIEAKLTVIAERSLSTVAKYQANGELDALYDRAQRDGLTYNLAYIPATFSVPSKEVFDRDYMVALYRTGYLIGRKGGGWQLKPPVAV